eukprot:TRINITY_DN227_c0_g1_i13.p1 TRINITY_DN227_c0_g1~~TRINITY_DN227_c0_g1_i13.p1  ORF type:complete len:611 (+),score=99.98 TRINITY_DN227_c0_g1_i13:175-2007(+)
MNILDIQDGFILGQILSYNVDLRSLNALRIASKTSNHILFITNQKFVGLHLTIPQGNSYSLLFDIGKSVSHLRIRSLIKDEDVSRIVHYCPNLQELNVCNCFNVTLSQFVNPLLKEECVRFIGPSLLRKDERAVQEILPPSLRLVLCHDTHIDLVCLVALLLQGVMIYAKHVEITLEAIQFIMMHGFKKWNELSEGWPNFRSIKNYTSLNELKGMGFQDWDVFAPEDIFDMLDSGVTSVIPLAQYHKWPFVWGYAFKSSVEYKTFKRQMNTAPKEILDPDIKLMIVRLEALFAGGGGTLVFDNPIWPKLLDPLCVKDLLINPRPDSKWQHYDILRSLSVTKWGRWTELLEYEDFVSHILAKISSENQRIVLHIVKEMLPYNKQPFGDVRKLPLNMRNTLLVFLLRGEFELNGEDVIFLEELLKKGNIAMFVGFVKEREWKRLNELNRDLITNALITALPSVGEGLVDTLHQFGFTNWEVSTQFIQTLVNKNNSPVLLALEKCDFLWGVVDMKKIEKEETVNQALTDLRAICLRKRSSEIAVQTQEQIQEWGKRFCNDNNNRTDNNNNGNNDNRFLDESEFFDEDCYEQESQGDEEDEEGDREEEGELFDE